MALISSQSEYRIFPPIWTTDAMLISTNVPDAIATTWTSGATFGLGDYSGAAPVTGQAQDVYQSIQSGNTNHALSDTAWWRFAGKVYQAYNPATAYSIGHIVADNTNHWLYKAVAASTGATLTDTTKWLKIGSTNRWACLDKTYGSQTECADEIIYEIQPGKLYDTICIFNVTGAKVKIEQSQSGYEKEIDLYTHLTSSWWQFFYNVPLRKPDTVFVKVPPYPTSTIKITITNPGNTTKCGMIIVGKSKTIGISQWDPERSIVDYSGSNEDQFGNVTLVQRTYSKRLKMDIYIPAQYEDEVVRVLEDHRATEIVVIGSELYTMTLIYGFLGAWKVSPSDKSMKIASIEMKGLV